MINEDIDLLSTLFLDVLVHRLNKQFHRTCVLLVCHTDISMVKMAHTTCDGNRHLNSLVIVSLRWGRCAVWSVVKSTPREVCNAIHI